MASYHDRVRTGEDTQPPNPAQVAGDSWKNALFLLWGEFVLLVGVALRTGQEEDPILSHELYVKPEYSLLVPVLHTLVSGSQPDSVSGRRSRTLHHAQPVRVAVTRPVTSVEHWA